MAYNRADIRTEVRNNLNELTADLFSDTQIDYAIAAEVRSLPRRGVYLEEVWEFDTTQNVQDYSLPDGTYKIELVEKNLGTSSVPNWEEVKGWKMYAGAIYFFVPPWITFTHRLYLRKSFTVLTDDTTTSDIPDEKMDLVIWGTVVRCLKMLMNYMLNAQNWDAIAKPDGITMPQVQAWLRDAKTEYKDLLKLYQTTPVAKDIDLVN